MIPSKELWRNENSTTRKYVGQMKILNTLQNLYILAISFTIQWLYFVNNPMYIPRGSKPISRRNQQSLVTINRLIIVTGGLQGQHQPVTVNIQLLTSTHTVHCLNISNNTTHAIMWSKIMYIVSRYFNSLWRISTFLFYRLLLLEIDCLWSNNGYQSKTINLIFGYVVNIICFVKILNSGIKDEWVILFARHNFMFCHRIIYRY